jgi:hypothetical protein
MPTSTDDRTDLERALDAFDNLVLYRYPHIAGPLFIAGLGLGLAWGAAELGAGWPYLLVVLVVVVFILGYGSIPPKDRPREHLYGQVCWIGGSLWMVAAALMNPLAGEIPLWRDLFGWSIPIMIGLWLLMLTILMPPWVKNRRVRRGVDVAKNIAAWDGDAIRLPGTKLSTAGSKAYGPEDDIDWEAPIRCTPKGLYHLAKLRDAIPNIAARYDVEVSQVVIDRSHGDAEGRYILRILKKQRRVGGQLMQLPEKRPSADKPFRIGYLLADRGTAFMSQIWKAGHGGIDGVYVGAKGYGKSTLFKGLACFGIMADNCLVFIADMSPGSPDYSDHLGPRGAYAYGRNYSEIDLIVKALFILCEIRGLNKRTNRARILALFDETALYFSAERPSVTGTSREARDAKRLCEERNAARVAAFNELVMVCRKYDISIRVAVQTGRARNLGSEARNLLIAGEVIGFFSPQPSDSAFVSAARLFELWNLPRGSKGEALGSNHLHPEVTRMQIDNCPDELIEAVLRHFGADQGDLMKDELEALAAGLGDEWATLRRGGHIGPTAPFVVDAPTPPEIPPGGHEEARTPPPEGDPPARRSETAEAAQDAVYAALVELGRPATAADVAATTTRSTVNVRRRLDELVELGRVTKTGPANGRANVYTPAA